MLIIALNRHCRSTQYKEYILIILTSPLCIANWQLQSSGMSFYLPSISCLLFNPYANGKTWVNVVYSRNPLRLNISVSLKSERVDTWSISRITVLCDTRFGRKLRQISRHRFARTAVCTTIKFTRFLLASLQRRLSCRRLTIFTRGSSTCRRRADWLQYSEIH